MEQKDLIMRKMTKKKLSTRQQHKRKQLLHDVYSVRLRIYVIIDLV